jgi:hypothetical protein
VTARRIALLISTFTMVAFATTVGPATAGTTTLSDLRSQLREVRLHLQEARATLSTARLDLTTVQAVLDAGGGTPMTVTAPLSDITADTTTVTEDPTAEAGTTTTEPATETSTIETAIEIVDPTTAEPTVDELLAAFRPTLATRLLADSLIVDDEVTALADRVEKWRRITRRLRLAESELEARIARRLQIAEWNREGEWRPLIEIAARRYDVSADGLYRLMMLESGGRRYAGTTYRGLFQYYPGTWRASWNPWRGLSIYNGWAQIRATAYAIHRGMGPSSWPSTYYRAF